MNPISPAAAVSSRPSPFHLTPEEIRSFDENGYLILRQRVTGKLLERIQ